MACAHVSVSGTSWRTVAHVCSPNSLTHTNTHAHCQCVSAEGPWRVFVHRTMRRPATWIEDKLNVCLHIADGFIHKNRNNNFVYLWQYIVRFLWMGTRAPASWSIRHRCDLSRCQRSAYTLNHFDYFTRSTYIFMVDYSALNFLPENRWICCCRPFARQYGNSISKQTWNNFHFALKIYETNSIEKTYASIRRRARPIHIHSIDSTRFTRCLWSIRLIIIFEFIKAALIAVPDLSMCFQRSALTMKLSKYEIARI